MLLFNAVQRMSKGVLEIGEFEDSPALAHGRTVRLVWNLIYCPDKHFEHSLQPLHLPICQLHQSILQQLGPSQASKDALRCGKWTVCRNINWKIKEPFISISGPMHVNCQAARSATPIHRRSVNMLKITTSKDAENRTRKHRVWS